MLDCQHYYSIGSVPVTFFSSIEVLDKMVQCALNLSCFFGSNPTSKSHWLMTQLDNLWITQGCNPIQAFVIQRVTDLQLESQVGLVIELNTALTFQRGLHFKLLDLCAIFFF